MNTFHSKIHDSLLCSFHDEMNQNTIPFIVSLLSIAKQIEIYSTGRNEVGK